MWSSGIEWNDRLAKENEEPRWVNRTEMEWKNKGPTRKESHLNVFHIYYFEYWELKEQTRE